MASDSRPGSGTIRPVSPKPAVPRTAPLPAAAIQRPSGDTASALIRPFIPGPMGTWYVVRAANAPVFSSHVQARTTLSKPPT